MTTTLYKKPNRIWSIASDRDSYTITHGLIDKKQQSKTTKIKPKGRRTMEEQMLSDTQSKINHKINREDYHREIDQSANQVRPMLALDALTKQHKIRQCDVRIQPKLDGLRCVAGSHLIDNTAKFSLFSRTGKAWENIKHIATPAQALLNIIQREVDPRVIALDAEIYLHGTPLQEIVSMAASGHTSLEYHVFDLVHLTATFTERKMMLQEGIRILISRTDSTESLQIVPTIHQSVDLETHRASFANLGYEGIMIRDANSLYTLDKRSKGLFKFKKFMFETNVKIVNTWRDRNDNIMFNCMWSNGKLFNCTPKASHETRKTLTNMTSCTVKYQTLSNDGLPQFPVATEWK